MSVCVCVWYVLQLYAKCTLTLESSYYNEKVAMWEPFIEPVEDRQTETHRPWTVAIEVCIVWTMGKGRVAYLLYRHRSHAGCSQPAGSVSHKRSHYIPPGLQLPFLP